MYQAMILPIVKGVCYFLPDTVSWNLLASVYVCRTKTVIYLWKLSRSYSHPPPADTRAHPEPCGDRAWRELRFAGGCSALLEEAEMGDLNGGLALQNHKGFYKQS